MAVRRKTARTPRKTTATRQRTVTVADSAGSTEALILATAETLFARDGYAAVSTKQLAAAAGLTIGALYHYFPSKEAVYVAAMRQAFADKAQLPAALHASSEPAEQRLAQLAAWFVDIIVADKNAGRLLQRELLDPRAGSSALLDSGLFREAFELFQELLRELLPGVDLDDALASQLALLFGFANLKGIAVLAPKVRHLLATPAEIGAHATSLLLHGLRR